MSDADGTNDDPGALAEAQRLVSERQWPVTVRLNKPVRFGKEDVEELVFQRGNFGVLRGLSIDRVPNVDELITIAARLCGQPSKVIESLDPDDASEVTGIALGFFARCRGAGKMLSRR